MLQPFETFKLIYVNRLLNLKKRYLVSQAYKRPFADFAAEHTIGILLTDYDSLGPAKMHLNAVKHDKYAALLDLENSAHREKVEEMLQGTTYSLFWTVVKSVKELQQQINANYKDSMKKYIDRHTNWKIDREATIRPSVEVTFGELFIVLKHAGQTLRIKFEEIETI